MIDYTKYLSSKSFKDTGSKVFLPGQIWIASYLYLNGSGLTNIIYKITGISRQDIQMGQMNNCEVLYSTTEYCMSELSPHSHVACYSRRIIVEHEKYVEKTRLEIVIYE